MLSMDHAKRVMIAIDENDKWHHESLATALIEHIKAHGGSGATVLRGMMGFGIHRRIHTSALVELSSKLPLVIIWVDPVELVDQMLPELAAMVGEGLITVEPVTVVRYVA